MSEESSSPEKISKYNSAMDINMWVQHLFKKAASESMHGRYQAWNGTLNSIWMELAHDCTHKDIEMMGLINDKLVKAGFKKFNSGSAFDSKPVDFEKKRDQIYEILFSKHLLLKKIQNKQGKGVAYEESIDDYMD